MQLPELFICNRKRLTSLAEHSHLKTNRLLRNSSNPVDAVCLNSRSRPYPGSIHDKINAILWTTLAPVSVYAPNATVILLILFVLAIPDFRAVWRIVVSPSFRFVLLSLGSFLAWCLLSSAWSPQPLTSLFAATKLTLICSAGVIYVSSLCAQPFLVRSATFRGLCACLILIACLLLFEFFSGAAIGILIKGTDASNLNFLARAIAILTILTFPVSALLTLRLSARWGLMVMPLIAALIVAPLPMFAGFAAICGGGTIVLFVWVFEKKAIKIASFLFCIFMVASPWVFTNVITHASFGERIVELPASWQHRLGIWSFVGKRALDRPMLGHGFDSSRIIGRESGNVPIFVPGQQLKDHQLPLHPHNFALQVWLELGAIGVMLFAVVLLMIANIILSNYRNRFATFGSMGLLSTVFTIMMVSFGAWQSWWMAAIWLGVSAVSILVISDGEVASIEKDLRSKSA